MKEISKDVFITSITRATNGFIINEPPRAFVMHVPTIAHHITGPEHEAFEKQTIDDLFLMITSGMEQQLKKQLNNLIEWVARGRIIIELKIEGESYVEGLVENLADTDDQVKGGLRLPLSSGLLPHN